MKQNETGAAPKNAANNFNTETLPGAELPPLSVQVQEKLEQRALSSHVAAKSVVWTFGMHLRQLRERVRELEAEIAKRNQAK